MNFISKLSKPLRNVQSFAIKHWKYIFVMFVLIAYIIHALFRKEGMMEYMDTPKSGSTAGMKEFAELVTDVVEKHNERLDDMEEKFKTLAMSSGDGELMDDLNGQAGSVEATPPPPTNVMQATPPPQTNVMQANSSASAAEKAAAEKAAAEQAAAEKAAKEAAAKAAAAKLEVLKQAMDSAKALHVKKVKLFNDTPKRKETARDRIKKERVTADKNSKAATTAYNNALKNFNEMYPEYSQ